MFSDGVDCTSGALCFWHLTYIQKGIRESSQTYRSSHGWTALCPPLVIIHLLARAEREGDWLLYIIVL